MENKEKGIQEFYNAIAEQFANDWYVNESLLPTLKQFMSLMPQNPRILDLGCGAGYESMRLKGLGAQVIGVDYSCEPIRIARERNPECRFEVMDFRQLDSSLGQFDGVVAIASLIHISDTELDIVFENMKNVVKSGGYVMTVVVEGQGISLEKSLIEMDGVKYNRTFYLHSKARLTEAAVSKGFAFYDELILDEESVSFGWKCYLYQCREI